MQIISFKCCLSVAVDFMAQKVIVDCDSDALERVIYCCNHFEDVKVIEEEHAVADITNDGINSAAATIMQIISFKCCLKKLFWALSSTILTSSKCVIVYTALSRAAAFGACKGAFKLQ